MGPKKMTGGYLIDTQVMVEGAQDKVRKIKIEVCVFALNLKIEFD